MSQFSLQTLRVGCIESNRFWFLAYRPYTSTQRPPMSTLALMRGLYNVLNDLARRWMLGNGNSVKLAQR